MEKKLPDNLLSKKIMVGDDSGTFGWIKSDILEFLVSSMSEGFAILGGDVMHFDKEKNRYVNTYDSWYINRNGPLEKFDDYSRKSREKAITYISNYKAEYATIIYVLIISSEVTAGLNKL